MKVEYSLYFDAPSLIIKGTDFLKALKDDDEYCLLQIAIDAFADKFDSVSHFNNDVNDELQQWLTKTGEVIYTIKERYAGNRLLDSWCEVYINNGGRPKAIVFSEDNGRSFEIRKKEAQGDE